MALRIYTGRLPHRTVPGYTGADGINVTRGSGGPFGGAFAPSRELLDEANARKRKAKRAEAALAAAWEWYSPLYTEEMRRSWVAHRAAWESLLRREGEVTLLCYCGTARRCHRRLLAAMLVAAGARFGLEVIDCGERAP